MKFKKLVMMLLLLSVLTICTFYNNITKAEGETEEKIYCDATIDDEFADNEILIVLTNEESLKFSEYTVNSFSEINCIAIDDLTDGYKDKIEQQLNGTYTGNMPVNLSTFNRIFKLTLGINSKQYVLNSIKELEKRSDILSAEPNYEIKINKFDSPNDTYYNNPYNGVSSAWAYESVHMEEAWEYIDGISNKDTILVGILDSGIYASHEDIGLNKASSFGIAFASSEGLTDENRIESINFLKDTDGHGTGIAGIIGAQRQNGKGISGICNDVMLVSLRIYNSQDKISDMIECIEFAEEKNVKIINCSLGWSENSTLLKNAISNFSGLMVCAAGNNGDSGLPVYPASYTCENIISVGAIMQDNLLWEGEEGSTKTGITNVDLFAPGDNIITTSNNGGYAIKSGTSFAAPFVTGVAAMILSIEPDLSTFELKTTILNNVTSVSTLTNMCMTGGILNAEAAIKNIHYHNYIYSYDSALYHRGECSCGAINLEAHTWINNVSGGKTCLKCGGTSLSLNYIKKGEEHE